MTGEIRTKEWAERSATAAVCCIGISFILCFVVLVAGIMNHLPLAVGCGFVAVVMAIFATMVGIGLPLKDIKEAIERDRGTEAEDGRPHVGA
ncbi:MAG: hypothetical protein U1A16_01850 [Patescibacteria group bacterium]|nr:hypothetical protein [Patescibacteria group bacterium]